MLHMSHLSLPVWLLFGSWWVFILFWGAMGFRNKRSIHAQPAAERRRYTLPLLAGVVMMSGIPRHLGPLGMLTRPLYPRLPAVQWTAAGVALLGLAIALWARVALGRNWSGAVTLKQDHELVTAGPYAAIRHPIYTALILLFAGIAIFIASGGGWIGLVFIIWSCWVKLRQEEALMLGQFPQSYPAYMARTKRLVPLVI